MLYVTRGTPEVQISEMDVQCWLEFREGKTCSKYALRSIKFERRITSQTSVANSRE